MRNSVTENFKDIFESCEDDINEIYHKCKMYAVEVGTVADADKNFVVARYHMINSEHHIAIEYLELAEKIYIAHGDDIALAFLYSQAAHCARVMGDKKKSEEYTDESIAASERIGDVYCLVYSYIYGAANAFFLGEYERGLKFNELTKSLLDSCDSSLQCGHYYQNVGFAGFFNEDYHQLVEYCGKAYNEYISHYGSDRTRHALVAANNQAEGYVFLKDYDKAAVLFERVIELSEEAENIPVLMNALMFKADLHYRTENYQQAYKVYNRYVKVYQRWLNEKLKNPDDENQELKRKLELAQDLEMVKSGEYIKKRYSLELLLSTQKFVREVGSQLISAAGISEIFSIICKAAKKLFVYDNISMGFVEGDNLAIRYLDSEDERERKVPFFIPISSTEYITTKCLREEKDIKLNTFEEYLELIEPQNREELLRTKSDFNQSLMFVCLTHEGKVFGLITIQKREPNMYTDEAFSAIQALGSFISIAVNNVFKTRMIEDKVRQLEVITRNDELTCLENRRAYNLYVEELVSDNREYMLIFADMNHLKQINDGIGHNSGDMYLIALADIIKACVKDYRKFRLSGDEFAVIIPNPSIEYTYELVEKIKRECAKIKIGEYPLAIAVGCGIRNRNENPDKVFSVAEARMYLDKHDYHKRLLMEIDAGRDVQMSKRDEDMIGSSK